MSPKNKPTIEGARGSAIAGKIIISGSVKFDELDRNHHYAFSIATREEVKKSLNDAEIRGPIILEIVPELVVYINMKRADCEKITGFENMNLGIYLTPNAFEKSMWEHARKYFQKYDFYERKRRITQSGMTTDLILKRLNKIPYEIRQAQSIDDTENEHLLEEAIIGIGKIVGCPRTGCDLAALLTTTDQTLLKLCPQIPHPVFDPKGILHARRVYEEEFLEVRRSTDYAKLYSALINAHVERITALIKGEYDVYSNKGEEISKLFSMIPRINLITETIEEQYKEPPAFKESED